MKRIILGVFVSILFVSLAQAANIYKCKDEKGRPLFSHTPCPDTDIDGESDTHQVWREMRTLVADD